MESSSLQALYSRFLAVDSDAAWQLAGWTMLHFLWVGAIVVGVAGVLRLATRRARPAVRYLAALMMLGLFAASPPAIAVWLVPMQKAEVAVRSEGISDFGSQISDLPTTKQAEAGGREPFFAAESGSEVPHVALPRKKAPDPVPVMLPRDAALDAVRSPIESFVTALPYIWLVGAPLMLLLLATGLIGGERLRRRSQTVTAGPVADTLELLRHRIGGRSIRRMAVAACSRVSSPVLIGIVRPLVLLPPAALTGWSPEQIEMVLLHELAHVRRWDNLVNLLQRLVESLLFFHPAVWWLSGWVRQEREHCCDAFVVRHLEAHGRKASRRSYARLLLDLAAADRARPLTVPGAAFAARNLRSRIRHILTMEEQPMRVSLKTLFATVALGVLMIALTTTAARGLSDADREPNGVHRTSTESEQEGSRTISQPQRELQQHEDDSSSPAAPDPAKLPSEDMSDPDETPEPAAAIPPSNDSLEQQYEHLRDNWDKLNAKREEYYALAEKFGGSGDPEQNLQVKMALSRWQENRAERRKLQRELANAYRMLTVTTAQHRDPSVIERMVHEAVSANPNLQQIRQQMLWLDAHITRYKMNAGNRRSGSLARLEDQKAKLVQQMQRLEAQERQRLMSQFESTTPNLTDEAAKKQYEAQARVLRSQIEALDKQNEEILEELRELTQQNEELAAKLDELVELTAICDQLAEEIEKRRNESPQDANGEEHESDPSTPRSPDSDLSEAENGDQVTSETGKLTYDGKDFDYWKNVWRTELKTERRTEAIRALAAFGAHGYGREAAETILDVVRNYNVQDLDRGAEQELIAAAVEALAGGGVRISLAEGLAVLQQRVTDGDPRLTEFARLVINRLPATDPTIAPYLLEFATEDSTPLRIAANHKLREVYVHADEALRERIVETFRASVSSDEKYVALTGLWGLYPILREDRRGLARTTEQDIRAGYVPELLQALQHEEVDVRNAALQVFYELGGKASDAVPELRKMLRDLPPGAMPGLVMAALRQIGPEAKEAAPELLDIFQATESDQTRAAIIAALAEMQSHSRTVFEYYLDTHPEKAIANMLEVVPELAAKYGRAAQPAAPYVAPFLLSEHSKAQDAALESLEEMTGSHEYAERFLERVVARLPSSNQAERASMVLERIAAIRREREAHERAASGPYSSGGDTNGTAPSGYQELFHDAEQHHERLVRPLDVPELIEKLQSSDPEQMKEAMLTLQLHALNPGTREAIDEVVTIVREGPDELRRLALGTLLRMQAAPELVLEKYLESGEPLVVQQVGPDGNREILTGEIDPHAMVAHYGPEIVPQLLRFLTHESEAVRRVGLQGLANRGALDVARRYLERRLAEDLSEEDAKQIAHMLKWVNALIEYYAEQPDQPATPREEPGEESDN